ncbi:MAG: hypothetical protein AB1393_12880 [Candidatus Edwardsbacteria bacterium]
MRTILPEFIGSMERIRNNFYFSFLALNFLNLRPSQRDVILPVNLSQNIMTTQSLNSFDNDGVQEYGNSIRRHFLNDIVIAYERYSMLMIASHKNGQVRIDPCHISDKKLGALLFEQLPNVYLPEDLTFLVQLRRLRNSIVHYNGVYSATNQLNYTFGTQRYNSMGNEGQNISIEFDNILWIYDKLMDTVRRGNMSYFTHYPIP